MSKINATLSFDIFSGEGEITKRGHEVISDLVVSDPLLAADVLSDVIAELNSHYEDALLGFKSQLRIRQQKLSAGVVAAFNQLD